MLRRRAAGLLGACTLSMALAASGGPPAGASPTDPGDRDSIAAAQARTQRQLTATAGRVADLQRRLAAAQRQLEAVNTRAALATERYNQATVLLAARARAAAEAQQRADRALANAREARDELNEVAAQMYMQGGSLDGAEAFLSPTGPQDLAARLDGAAAASSYRNRTLQDAKATLAIAAELQRQAAAAHLQQLAAAEQARRAFTAAKAEAQSAASQTASLQAQETSLLAELAGLRRTSVDLEQRRLHADEMEAARRALGEALRRSGRTGTRATVSRAAAAKAIAFAQAQLGEPYVWGGDGPNSWDCSGLTQAAWRAGGRSLSHYTGSQWQETTRVALDELEPGDLVFFGTAPGSIHHVGLYVGSGMMIEAPRTGLDVRYSSIWRHSLIPYGGRP